jgi:hypothetical protein
MTPISLLTSITATIAVLSSITASAMSRSIGRLSRLEGGPPQCPPLEPFGGIEQAACSVATVTSLRRFDCSKVPLSAQLSARSRPK